MERKLASIRKVNDILTHNNADNLEIVIIDGWRVVVKKGEFKKDELVVYYEIDSFLPIQEEYSFLHKCCFKTHPNLGDGYKLKTIKLRGEISQGLVLPLHLFNIDVLEGMDVTKHLGIQLWDSPQTFCPSALTKGLFPHFIPKTDQERIQNCFRMIQNIKNTDWNVTEKLDGSSITIYWNKGDIGICSRNLELKLEGNNNNYIYAVNKSGILDSLDKLGYDIAIQGELCGPGIQGNRYKLKEVKFYIFDIWLISEQRYVVRDEFNGIIGDLIETGVNIVTVPQLSPIFIPDSIEEILLLAEGKSILNPSIEREGIVVRSSSIIGNEVISFKIISNKYLLKYDN